MEELEVLCEYGCGREALFQFKNKKWCCSKFLSQCPSMKKKNGDGHRKEKKQEKNQKFVIMGVDIFLTINLKMVCGVAIKVQIFAPE